ncbi:tRNA pseudouridine(55) synthase TruB [Patescibacteria group bacterium]|nr:tRNA pseudouridine(55) synthase TruB [Patescibacteria group bacterium]
MILNIYKQKNWTSFDVVAKIKSLLKVKKAGHAGTLDPLAEGVLIVLTEKDTKKQSEIMNQKKEYVAEIAFGASTETLDLEETPVLSENLVTEEVLRNEIPAVLSKYEGEIEQEIPKFSAKKVKGKPLYKKARKNLLGEYKPEKKTVNIYESDVLDVYSKEFETNKGNKTLPVLKCRVVCSSGSYIRQLAADLGNELGTRGVLVDLVRTRIGEYTLEKAVKVSELKI